MQPIRGPAFARSVFLSIVALGALHASGAEAQSSNGGIVSTQDAASVARPPGAGLEFLITSDFTLSSLSGALVSYRTRAENGKGWRVGVDLGGALAKFEASETLPDTTILRDEDTKNGHVGLVLERMFTSATRRDLRLLWGVGPDLGYSVSHTTGRGESFRSTDWHAGIAGNLGVECLLADRITLLAEYGAFVGYYWDRVKTSSGSSASTRREHSFSIGERQVRLGLTAWFR
jgi:hypothetical protein